MPERLRKIASVLITVGLAAIVAYGVIAAEPTPEERLDDLGNRIACPVCDGTSIAASPSTYARDMLALVEDQIAAGMSDDEILEFFEARYTAAIRLDAPATSGRVLLWAAPFAVAAAGLYLALSTRRRNGERV